MCDTETYIKNHIKRVQNKLFKLITALSIRLQDHDKSKLQEPELSMWKKMDEEPRYPYGSKEYKDKIERYHELFEMHYKNNPHHPEHFQNGISDMTLIDLAEMLCDWISYKDDIRVTEAIEMVEKQSKRFGYSDEIKNMLINTLNTYFTVLGDKKEFNLYQDHDNYIKNMINKYEEESRKRKLIDVLI